MCSVFSTEPIFVHPYGLAGVDHEANAVFDTFDVVWMDALGPPMQVALHFSIVVSKVAQSPGALNGVRFEVPGPHHFTGSLEESPVLIREAFGVPKPLALLFCRVAFYRQPSEVGRQADESEVHR